MKITDAFLPHLQLCESHHHFYRHTGIFPQAVECIAGEGFFKSIGLFDIPDADERKRIGQIVRSANLSATVWSGYFMWNNDEQRDVSALDENLRKKTVTQLTELFDGIAQCGAGYLGLVSGFSPGQAQRPESLEQFFKSVCELCQAAKSYSIEIMLELLDYDAHKKFTFGSTDEAVKIIKEVKKSFDNVSLCWDSAHVMLNGEDLADSLNAMTPYLSQLHFANPVIDRKRKDFGDHHILMGSPGAISLQTMANIFSQAVDSGLFVKKMPAVSPEIRALKGSDPWSMVALTRKTLQQAWDLYESSKV